MHLLAIDPGPTTGFALYTQSGSVQTNWTVWQDELPEKHPHIDLWIKLHTIVFDTLIVENFEYRKEDAQKRNKIDLAAAQYVGVVNLFAQANPHITFVVQQGSQVGKTAFWSDDNKKVKKLGLYNPKAAPHGMDALRHVLYYLSFTLGEEQWFTKLK